MKTLPAAAALAALLLLSACVVATAPLGERPAHLDPADWNGLWRVENEAETYRIEVIAASAGRAEVTRVDKVDRLEVEQATLMAGGGGLFLSFARPEGQLWFRLERQGERITLRAPSPDRFKAEIAAGRLAGRVEPDLVHLAPPDAAALRRLAAAEGSALYMPEAMVLERRGGPR